LAVTPLAVDLVGTDRGDKITPRHRERRAYVYVRQSTLQQVEHHRESRENQYALVQRAQALGWPRERVHVVDADLGQSGQDGGRPGFRELVAAVSLGQVGLVLAYEASRLARNNALCRRRHKAFYAVQRLMPRCPLGAGLARSVES
jgi:Resolvase, N terminal domain